MSGLPRARPNSDTATAFGVVRETGGAETFGATARRSRGNAAPASVFPPPVPLVESSLGLIHVGSLVAVLENCAPFLRTGSTSFAVRYYSTLFSYRMIVGRLE